MQVEMKKKNDNPFFKKNALRNLQMNGSQAQSKQQLYVLINQAWEESKNDLITRQMFFVLLFEIGDISNRQHSIFKGKNKDSGGHAAREQFMWAMQWMRKHTVKQYYKFLTKDLFRQFVGIFSILAVRIRTAKKTNKVIDVINTINEHDNDKLATYIAKILKKSNPVEKILIFKALTRVRVSKRQKTNRSNEKVGSRPLQDITMANMRAKEEFYMLLSDKMGWEYIEYPNNIKFIGMNEAKKEYSANLESRLFSSGKIKEFDREEFLIWLDTLPAGARRRTRVRLLTKENDLKGDWISKVGKEHLGKWFVSWELLKEQKQAEERVLVEKKRQGTITDAETVKLQKVKKEAKVTTGGTTLMQELESFIITDKIDNTMIHSIMDKIQFQVRPLFIVDKSGSMSGWNHIPIKGHSVAPYKIAQLLVTLGLMKMPPSDVDELLIGFGSSARVYCTNSEGQVRENRFMAGRSVAVPTIVDRTKDFAWNFRRLSSLTYPDLGGTNFSSVAHTMKAWADDADAATKQVRIEMIQDYPVFIVVSDGDMNNMDNANASMRDFMSKMQHWFGWNGVVLVWDTGTSNEKCASKFEDIPNVFHRFGWNLGSINTLFKGIHDLDVLDTYLDLLSLHKSNRYKAIQEATL